MPDSKNLTVRLARETHKRLREAVYIHEWAKDMRSAVEEALEMWLKLKKAVKEEEKDNAA